MSKSTLAWINNGGQQEISRVPWQGKIDDPEHPDTSKFPGSTFGFVSSAALMPVKDAHGSQLSVGRQSLSNDDTFPIKTLLLWAAGIRRSNSLKKAPCGPETIKAVSAGNINVDMVERVFEQHLRLVYNLALAQAANLGLTIVHICITHPNFLCEHEEADDFRRLVKLCRRVVRLVCGEDKSISTINEGQSLAIYITEIFVDALGSFNRTRFWDKLRHLNKAEGLPLLVLDCGGSTTNMQVQLAFFNDKDEMTASQSLNFPTWRTGVQGGSHLANFKVRALIVKAFGPRLPPGELAALLNNFELEKRTLDWTKTPLPTITLHGSKPSSIFSIPASVLKPIFKSTFQGGLDCLQEMGQKLLALKQDFAIVLSGGSYYDRGLRGQVNDIVRHLKDDAKCCDVNVESILLADHDTQWSSGVSAGAALSVLRLPYPVDALESAAIGLQTQWALPGRGLVGENSAPFLLSKGCQIMPSITVEYRRRPDPKTFTLVCDPVYYRTPPGYGNRGPRPADPHNETEASFDLITIAGRQQTIPAYEMGFSFQLSDLPPGRVRITLGGHDATAFAKNLEFPPETPTLEFELIAQKVNLEGQRIPHKRDKRWLLRLEPDGATKYVIVGDAKEIPSSCQCPTGSLGVPAVHQCMRSAEPPSSAPQRRAYRPRRVARNVIDARCSATCTRGKRVTRSAVKRRANNIPRALDSIEVAGDAPSRSRTVTSGYESITSMSSSED